MQYNESIMKVQIPSKVNEIIKNFEDHKFEIYIVGGAVRDVLMGKLIYDWDLTTNATPDQIVKIFKDAFYDNVFGTVGIPPEKEGERPYEITTFRTEHGYSDLRRPDKVIWGITLTDDLQRRDFTINAMALKRVEERESKRVKGKNKESLTLTLLHSYTLIDPFDGQKDLENKIVRAVGDPNERFSEDALRMMRAIRIAAELGFAIEEETFAAIKTNATLIHRISEERVRDELFKILASKNPYEGILLFKNSSLLEETLPELQKTF